VARKATGRPNGRPNKRALGMCEWLGSPQIVFDERGRPVGRRTPPAEHEKAVPEHWERMLAVEIEMRWVYGRRPSLAQVAKAALPYRISRDGVAKLRGAGERYSRLLHYQLGCLIAAQMAEEEGEGFTLQTTRILCE
jgi:hypothetical protein